MDKNITISADIPNINDINNIHQDYYYDYKKQKWIFLTNINECDISLRHLAYLESIKEDSTDEEEKSSLCLSCYICKIVKRRIQKITNIIYNLKIYKK